MSIGEFFKPLNTKSNSRLFMAMAIASLAVLYAPFAPSFIMAMAVLLLWYAVVFVAFCVIEHLINKNKSNPNE